MDVVKDRNSKDLIEAEEIRNTPGPWRRRPPCPPAAPGAAAAAKAARTGQAEP